MKKSILTAVMVIVVISLAGSLFGQTELGQPKKFDWGFGIHPGYTFMKLGDFADAKATFEKSSDGNDLFTTTAEDFSGQFTSYFNVFSVYNLPNGHKIGFDTGYEILGGGTYLEEGHLKPAGGLGKAALLNEDSMSKWALRGARYQLNFNYKYPVNLFNYSMDLRLSAGLSYNTSSLKNKTTYEFTDYGGQVTKYSNSAKFTDNTIGSQFSIGLEYMCCTSMAFKFLFGYSCAKFNNYSGTEKDDLGNSWKVAPVMWDTNDGRYLGLRYKDHPTMGEYDKLNVNMGGFSMLFGVQYYLPCFF